MMIRRAATVAALAVLVSFATLPGLEAQERAGTQVRRVGVLMSNDAADALAQRNLAAFTQALEQRGWTIGRNLVIDVRWGAGDPDRMRRYARELVAGAPDALLVQGAAVPALQQENRNIPVVFVVLHDPAGRGIVASLARPSGNLTGFTDYDPLMGGKWLEVLKESAPHLARVLVLGSQGVSLFWRSIEDAARRHRMTATAAVVHDDRDIDRAISSFARPRDGGLLVVSEAFTTVHRKQLIESAARHRVPAVYPFRFFAGSGGLMSYGVDPTEQFRHAASYIDRILSGAKPGDLPVQQPTKFELVINLKTAKALGLTIPPSLLLRADEVIE